MAKLSNLGHRVERLAPRLGFASREEAEKVRLADRDRSVEWRAWYKSPEWQALRRRVFKRDHYVCQQTGVLLIGKAPAPDSPVADHIKPHRGDRSLFFDDSNVQTVSKAWHDSVKQAQERSDPCAHRMGIGG